MNETPNVCPRCGVAFSCGMRVGEAECWCAALPAAFAVPAEGGGECYCPRCLAELIEARRQAPREARG
ncbi:hypothetical protein MASR2M50_05330 [Thauera sp.]|nr:cysteine-rich CWC family protein [Thauera sp.]